VARTSKKQVERSFAHLINVIGGEVATSSGDVGAYWLDHSPVNGGYRIIQFMEHSGERSPFGDGRLSADAFCTAVAFTLSSMSERRRNDQARQTSDAA
jgi:hypothetical protein